MRNNVIVDGDDYRANDFAASLWSIAQDQLAMNPIPQVARPMLEALFNYDTFRSRPIDSAAQQRLPAPDRYTSSTSAAAVELEGATGMSPNRIDHLVTGYLGWFRVQALNVADVMVRPMTDLPSNPRRDMSKTDRQRVRARRLRERGEARCVEVRRSALLDATAAQANLSGPARGTASR